MNVATEMITALIRSLQDRYPSSNARAAFGFPERFRCKRLHPGFERSPHVMFAMECSTIRLAFANAQS